MLCAGLVAADPVDSPAIEQSVVALIAAENDFDMVSPLDLVVGGLGGADGSLSDALAATAGALPSLDDLGGTFVDGLASADIPFSLAGDDWLTQAWDWLTQAWNWLNQAWTFVFTWVFNPNWLWALTFVLLWNFAPVISPIADSIWDWLDGLFGVDPDGQAIEGLASVVSFADLTPEALGAGALDVAAPDITPVFSDGAEALDLTTVVQDLSAALDLSGIIPGLDTVFDTAGVADIGEVLTSLIP
ncbi:hypothetical protein [Mycobacterium shimoidei]|uniref:hypothetical protein n=1 Tax=Mycobacterium shimoidei TaxID=29313 RepID=UPI000DEBCBD3|nr:hypothetical protein [Mycobacterium shimoidei]